MSATKDVEVVVCPGCGKAFVCGISAGLSTCWCMEKPMGLPVPGTEARCYCPECLGERVSELRRESVREAG